MYQSHHSPAPGSLPAPRNPAGSNTLTDPDTPVHTWLAPLPTLLYGASRAPLRLVLASTAGAGLITALVGGTQWLLQTHFWSLPIA